MTQVRIAVYGDVDVNLLDGSAVWLGSLVQTLAEGEGQAVTVFLKAPVRRDLIVADLRRLPSVRLVEPPARLAPAAALDAIEEADRDARFDAVFLRGRVLCLEAARRPQLAGRLWCYLTDIAQSAEALTVQARAELAAIATASRTVLCQTEELRAFLEAHVPDTRGRSILLPPMIPPPADAPPAAGEGGRERAGDAGALRIVYAGKFAPLWASREMIAAFRRLRARCPGAELHVYGDKIHDPPDDPEFRGTVEAGLRETAGLAWHGAVPREELLADLGRMHLAWSWRLPALNASLELSTKLLEYGAAGLPVLLNRTPKHEELLGADYPLFADDEHEVAERLGAVAEDPALLAAAAAAAQRASRAFTFETVYREHLAPALASFRLPRPVRAGGSAPKLLVAGHDLRFFGGIERRLRDAGVEVLVDRWSGHDKHDPQVSRELLAQADVIHCEWCLGNALWYARNKRPDQRLVVRLHRQEMLTRYPALMPPEAVDRLIFVSQHVQRAMARSFGWMGDKGAVVPNAVDTHQFHRPKLPGAPFNLGMIGFSPRLKRLDRALDVLEALRGRQPRFTLFLKGRLPWEYGWLWARQAERQYYEEQLRRIGRSPLLRNAVVFDPYGGDVASWLRKIGLVLSVSDFESFHMAVAEGTAAESMPLLLPWEGAAELYPPSWVSESPRLLAERALDLACRPPAELARLRAGLREEAWRQFDVVEVTRRFLDLLFPGGAVEAGPMA